MGKKTKQIAYTALFLAVGILLPQALHPFGLGAMLLPIQLGVLIGSFFLSTSYCAVLGILTAALSNLFFGMPPYPAVLVIAAELTAYGVTVGALTAKTRLPVLIRLVIAMLTGRAFALSTVYLLTTLFALNLPAAWAYVSAATVTALPGIALQLVLVPLAVKGLRRNLTT